MIDAETKVIEVIQRAKNIKSFRFEKPEGSDFIPGQWFLLTLDINGEKTTKPFSFSDSPTEDGYMEFTKRITSSPFSERLDVLKKGDKLYIRLSGGVFTFKGEHQRIALLSAGMGITPFRSMCKYATDKRLDTDIVLLYGNSTEENIVFKDQLDEMCASNPRLKIVYTLTSPEAFEKGWAGCSGFIDSDMIRREVSDIDSRVFFVCGPPDMVQCLKDLLKEEIGVPEDRVKIEGFSGY